MEDAPNAMVAVMWIAMCAVVMDNAGIVMAMGEPDALNVVEMEGAGIVAVQGKSFAGSVMEKAKFGLVVAFHIGKNAKNVVEQDMHHALNVLLRA